MSDAPDAATLAEQIDALLRVGLDRLGFESFRPGQAEAITTVLTQGALLLVAPTGGGKSMTFQLPATVLPGTTLVVSPLIALMQDQVAQLGERGIPATYLASTLDGAEVSEADCAALERVCILFDGNDPAAVDRARGQWKALTGAGIAAQYWSEQSGRWQKKAESNG